MTRTAGKWRLIVSSQEFPPASYPLYADNGSGGRLRLAGAAHARPVWLHTLLFALTLLTTTAVGAAMQFDFDRNLPFDVERAFALYPWFWHHPAAMLPGLPFSLTLLTILLAHEFGHYLAAMYHRVDASLPYFLPSPLLGHLRRVHPVRSPIYTQARAVRHRGCGTDRGLCLSAAGALHRAGVFQSDSRHRTPGHADFRHPGLQRLMEGIIFPGTPAADIYLHPVARAAWVGMFTTGAQPAAHRPTGWRAHFVFVLSGAASH